MAGARGPLTDAIPLGGSSEGLFAFGPMPDSSRILRALLVLHPHEARPRITERVELIVEHVGAFRGGPLPARHGTQPTAFAAARRALPAGPAHPIRLDVTSAARSSSAGVLHLLVRVEGDAELSVSSPWATATGDRPRLELMVR